MLVIAKAGTGAEFEEVLKRWKGNLSLLCAQSSDITFRGEGAGLLLLTAEKLDRVVTDDAVFILQGDQNLPERFCCRNCMAILDSASTQARAQAVQRHIPALTCGLSLADTFNFSSMTAESAVLALGRPVTAFDGTTVEPFERPVKLDGVHDPFCLLACAAALTMLGKSSPLFLQ